MFDNVFSNRPSFLLMTVVAYNVCSRAPLLNCKRNDDFEVHILVKSQISFVSTKKPILFIEYLLYVKSWCRMVGI